MNTLHVPKTADLLLLHPASSLLDQIRGWAAPGLERRVRVSFERKLPEIRDDLREASKAIVDASEDPCLAAEAFLQAAAQLGSGGVAVYADVAPADVEKLVRVRGSLFLLGPLLADQWAEFFQRFLREPAAAAVLQEQPLPRRWLDAALRRQTPARCVPTDRRWPIS